MKKITAKQYAMALYEAVNEARGEELRHKIGRFLELLKKQKQLKNLNKIFNSFVLVYQEKKGIMPATVVSAREFGTKVKQAIQDWIKDYTGRDAILTEEVRPDIIGGLVIKFDDAVLDASFKRQLQKMNDVFQQ